MTVTDLTLLEGMKFCCLEGCGFCCSYPAEVKEYECSFSHIRKVDPDALKKWETDDPLFCNVFTMKQYNDIGACIFLKEDKRCGIYSIRSILCKTYPIKIFFGWRIQLYTSMACRGVVEAAGSSELLQQGKKVLADIPAHVLQRLGSEAQLMYSSLPDILDNYMPPETLQAELLAYAQGMVIDPVIVSQEHIIDLESQLASGDIIDLPAYLAEDLKWLVFKLENDQLLTMVLKRTGETETIQSRRYGGISPKQLSAAAIEAVRNYLLKIARSDHFTGMIYLNACNSRTNESIIDRAIRLLNFMAGSFLVKASFLATFDDLDEVDEKLVRETIIFSDGYLATEPAYGLIL